MTKPWISVFTRWPLADDRMIDHLTREYLVVMAGIVVPCIIMACILSGIVLTAVVVVVVGLWNMLGVHWKLEGTKVSFVCQTCVIISASPQSASHDPLRADLHQFCLQTARWRRRDVDMDDLMTSRSHDSAESLCDPLAWCLRAAWDLKGFVHCANLTGKSLESALNSCLLANPSIGPATCIGLSETSFKALPVAVEWCCGHRQWEKVCAGHNDVETFLFCLESEIEFYSNCAKKERTEKISRKVIRTQYSAVSLDVQRSSRKTLLLLVVNWNVGATTSSFINSSARATDAFDVNLASVYSASEQLHDLLPSESKCQELASPFRCLSDPQPLFANYLLTATRCGKRWLKMPREFTREAATRRKDQTWSRRKPVHPLEVLESLCTTLRWLPRKIGEL